MNAKKGENIYRGCRVTTAPLLSNTPDFARIGFTLVIVFADGDHAKLRYYTENEKLEISLDKDGHLNEFKPADEVLDSMTEYPATGMLYSGYGLLLDA